MLTPARKQQIKSLIEEENKDFRLKRNLNAENRKTIHLRKQIISNKIDASQMRIKFGKRELRNLLKKNQNDSK